MDIVLVALVGVVAGTIAGLLGVGGGVLFVPALTIGFGLGQLEAEATSLLAMIPVALLGAWRQAHYGNLDLRTGVQVGLLAAGGVGAGVALANVLPQRALEVMFALLMLFVAFTMVRRVLADPPWGAGEGSEVPGGRGGGRR